MYIKKKHKKIYMKYINLPDIRKAQDTLCWDCKKALNSGCSWSNPVEQRPVRGWKALRTSNGYLVKTCPQFERCTWCRGRYREPEDYIEDLESMLKKKLHRVDRNKVLIGQLRDTINRLEWQNSVHMSE